MDVIYEIVKFYIIIYKVGICCEFVCIYFFSRIKCFRVTYCNNDFFFFNW